MNLTLKQKAALLGRKIRIMLKAEKVVLARNRGYISEARNSRGERVPCGCAIMVAACATGAETRFGVGSCFLRDRLLQWGVPARQVLQLEMGFEKWTERGNTGTFSLDEVWGLAQHSFTRADPDSPFYRLGKSLRRIGRNL